MAIIEGMGHRLKIERTKSKLTQRQVAERLGITEVTVSSYEREEYMPPGDVLIKLATIYGCTTDYLYGLDRERTISAKGLSDDDIAALHYTADRMRKANDGF